MGTRRRRGDIRHRPYLTTWTPLDDVTEENGTIYVLPQSELGIRTWVAHEKDPATNDWVGYFGSSRGVPVIIPAGSMAIFSSYTFHSSGANRTPAMRRVFLTQYSAEPILRNDGTIWANAVPVHAGGERGAAPCAPCLADTKKAPARPAPSFSRGPEP